MSEGLSLSRLKEVLSYCPDTGLFTRLENIKSAPAGSIAGSMSNTGYRIIMIDGKNYRAGRLAFFYMEGRWPTPTIDHINRIRDDDRFCNLREASSRQQNINKEKRCDNTSGETGVLWHSGNRKWQAQMRIKGRKVHLGYFDKKEDAVNARRSAAQKYHEQIFPHPTVTEVSS